MNYSCWQVKGWDNGARTDRLNDAAPYHHSNQPVDRTATSSKIHWADFDVDKYLEKTKIHPGEDAYNRNKFNQLASDKTQMDRNVPDSRQAK